MTTPKTSSEKLSKGFRREIKAAILNERRIGIKAASCPICGLPLGSEIEMHEVFLSRGDVQKAPPDIQARIHTPANCVNVHPACHPEPGQEPQKTQLVRFLLLFEGYTSILAWLQEMNELLRGDQVGQEIRYLNQTAERVRHSAEG